MVDHLAWAQGYRDRAAKCQLSAKSTSSVEFGKCYRLLEKYYLMLANLEEDFGRRQLASLMPPVSLRETEKKPSPAASPRQPHNRPASFAKNEIASENQSALSASARMLAAR